MQIKSVAFNNFKVLRNCNAKFEKRISLIIGKNSSGKTTIMEGLFRVLRNLVVKSEEDKNVKHFLNKSQNTLEGDITLSIKIDKNDLIDIYRESSIIKNPNHNAIVHDNIIIKWFFTNTGFQNYEVKLEKQSPGADLSELLECINIITTKVSLIESSRTIPVGEPLIDKRDLSKDEFKNYVRNHVLNLSKKDFNNLSSLLKKLFPQYILLPPTIENSQVKLETKSFAEQFEPLFDINEMSDGFKQILSILVRIIRSNDKILLIDEPDISLHTDLLKKFMEILIHQDRQIIFSSHNENLLNSFSEDLINYVSVETNLSSIIVPLSLSNRTKLLNDLGCNMSNFNKTRLIGSKLIIFIEDKPKEEENLINLLRLADIDIERLKISFETTGGGGLISYQIIDKIHGSRMNFILLRDRDEHTPLFIENANKKLGDRIHFWSRRELENYWIDSSTILSLIRKKTQKKEESIQNKVKNLDDEYLKNKILKLSDEFKTNIKYNSVFKKYRIIELIRYNEIGNFIKDHKSDFIESYALLLDNKKKELIEFYSRLQERTDRQWSYEEVVKVCPGKKLLSKIYQWISSEFKITISDKDILRNMINIDNDVLDLVKKIKTLLPKEDLSPLSGEVVLQLIDTKASLTTYGREISIS